MGVVDIGQELFGAVGDGQDKDQDQPDNGLFGVAFKPVLGGLAVLIWHGLRLGEGPLSITRGGA